MDVIMIEPWVRVFASIAGTITAIVGVWIGFRQLKRANKQLEGLDKTLRMSGLSAVLVIENDMHARMHRMGEIGTRIGLEQAKTKPNKKALEALERNHKACKEHYINAADRLAFCIRHEYVPKKDWQAEYREFISNIITDHPEFFGPNSIYTNIIDLNNEWKRS